MPAYFRRLNPFEQNLVPWIKEILDAWQGVIGIPFRQTAVSDADSWAVDIQNTGTGGKGIRVHDSLGVLQFSVDDTGVYPPCDPGEPQEDTSGWTDDGTTVRLTTASDKVVIGQNTFESNGNLHIHSDRFRVAASLTPIQGVTHGYAGEIGWDSDYVYVCVTTGLSGWKRAALSSF